MATKVVDASAAAALLFREDGSTDVAVALEGALLAAPVLLPFEIANVCLKKIRRYPAMRDGLVAAFGMFPRLGVRLLPINQPEALLLAEQTSLSAYDASYLWLAWTMRAELVTLDRRLQRAYAATQPN
ncbi:MAG: type II toxin-antitoxin system VapC family toxin [Rhodospirillales bacterium]